MGEEVEVVELVGEEVEVVEVVGEEVGVALLCILGSF